MKKIFKNYSIIIFLMIFFILPIHSEDLSHWKLVFDPQKAFDTCNGEGKYFLLQYMFKYDSSNYFFIGNSGSTYNRILKTTDAGKSWEMVLDTKRTYSIVNITSGTIINPDSILLFQNYLFLAPLILFRTVNGGKTWDTINMNMKGRIYPPWQTSFLNNGTGIIYLIDSTDTTYCLFRTTDFGLSWDRVPVNPNYHSFDLIQIFSKNSYSGSRCVNANQNPKIYHFCRTNDAGKTWIDVPMLHNEFPKTIKFIDSFVGWSSLLRDSTWGDSSQYHSYITKIIKTVDGGKTWKTIFEKYIQDSNFTSGNFNDLDFLDSNNIVFLGFGGQFLRTKDGGENWIYNNSFVKISKQTQNFNGSFVSNKRMIFASIEGQIYLWDEDGFPEEEVKEELNLNNQLLISPNPAYNDLNLKTKLNEPCRLNLEILNTFGQSALPTITEFADVGIYSKYIDLSGIAQGLYFVTINNGKERYIQKFVKIE
jgi:photosystem II stability/assembly factor-like uncharacterized protein